MNKRIADAILEPYLIAKHRFDGMPDDMEVLLLCRFKLGDLRELERSREAIVTSSGVPGDGA
jgi:hypothetical protein